MDEQLRLLERRAAQGDPDAVARFRHERVRAGLGLGMGAWLIDVLEREGLERVDVTSIAFGVRAVLKATRDVPAYRKVFGCRLSVTATRAHALLNDCVVIAFPTAHSEFVTQCLIHTFDRAPPGTQVEEGVKVLAVRVREAPVEGEAREGPWLRSEHHAAFLAAVRRAEGRRTRA